jgi:hypothetical protein
MNLKKTFLTACAATLLATSAASAAPYWRDRDHDGRRDNGWAERHDRDGYRDNWNYDRHYYNNHHRRYVDHYRVFEVVRAHHYRYIGEPFWYGDDYVIRAYDPYGRVVFVRIDPYSGGWGGVISLRF